MEKDENQENQSAYLRSLPKRLISPGVYARVLRNEKGRLELAVICDENITAEDLRSAWPVIDLLRQRILDVQGTDFSKYGNIIKMNVAYMHFREHFSYAEIALDLNYDSLCNLVRAVEYLKSSDIRKASQLCWAVCLRLDALGMKRDEIWDWIIQGISAIQQGRAPWSLTDGPADKRRVMDAIRQIGREFESKRLVFKQGPPVEAVDIGTLLERNQATSDTAKALLRQLPNDGGYDRLTEAHRRNPLRGGENLG